MTMLKLQFKTTNGSELLFIVVVGTLPLLLVGLVPEKLQAFILILYFLVLLTSCVYVLYRSNNIVFRRFVGRYSVKALLLVFTLMTVFFLCGLSFFSTAPPPPAETEATAIVLSLMIILLLAPLAEELLFRQMLLSWLVNKRRLSLPWVVILLSLLFTLLHPVSTYWLFCYYFGVSLLLFWIRIHWNSLLLCVLAHLWLNLLVVGRHAKLVVSWPNLPVS